MSRVTSADSSAIATSKSLRWPSDPATQHSYLSSKIAGLNLLRKPRTGLAAESWRENGYRRLESMKFLGISLLLIERRGVMRRLFESRWGRTGLHLRPPSGVGVSEHDWTALIVDPVEQVEELARLREQGLLSRAEYEQHRARVLGL